MNLQWQAVIEHLPTMLKASVTTIELVVLSCVLGLILGVVLGLLRSSKHLWVKALPFLYIFFFRGTPLLIQIFLIYQGLGQFDFIKDSFLWEPVFKQAYWCAIIAFTLNTAAYIAEIVRGAIAAIPKGELEAADAIGMSKFQKIRRIMLPRAFGIMIPAYSNEVIFILKGSALAASITITELTLTAKNLAAKNYLHIEMYAAAGVIYLILAWIIMFGFKLFEGHINKHKHYVPPTTA
ncbi:ABC transporter permease [Moraxella ovis]|uniref:ABC transporter permease n=1 Tax=Moraxella ovis TaxID=29433 RepID=UPI000D85473B|nr:ABC transporter permease subunit [Moraxella ovis]SPX81498.1 Inner membrane amino-acid ABC transporter permease protein yecS [Moraxella ovis]STZ05919.1 Inner membrane amino-acid ABC transporter permease protein yecS [Moraxella ovis]